MSELAPSNSSRSSEPQAEYPLDVEALLAYADANPRVERSARPASSAPQAGKRALAARFLGAAWPTDGSRYEAHLALAGALVNEGWSDGDCVAFLEAVYKAAGATSSSDHAMCVHTSRSVEKRTGFPRLAEYVGDVPVTAARKLLAEERDAPLVGLGERRSGTQGTVAEEPASISTPRPLTDSGNAERFADQNRGRVRYLPAWDKWLAWDGARWTPDALGTVQLRAKETVRSIYAEASEETDLERRAAVAKWARGSEGRFPRENLIKLARCEPGIAIGHEELDRDPWLFNVANGTLDLRAGALRPHDPRDLLTKSSPVAFDPEATCPIWDAFLLKVMGGNAALVSFLARAIGYSMTGTVGEQCLFFPYGLGANGKSTFTGTVQEVMGDYGKQTAPSLLMVRYGESHPTEQADLHGVRFAVCQEVEAGKAWAESTVKQLTGGDKIRARRMREDFWEFDPTHKLWICANHKPKVRGIDEAMWRRIKVIPFTVTIPQAERDGELPAKLRAELPGILAWAVRGCLAWQRDGLGFPQEVQEATGAYRTEQDHVGAFLEEDCHVGVGKEVSKPKSYQAYRYWCDRVAERPLDRKEFYSRLEAHDFTERKSGGERLWVGFCPRG